MRLTTTLWLAALTLFSTLSAIEVRLNIPLEELSLSDEGIFLVPGGGGAIPLPNLSHDERGFYSMCDATFICDVCGGKSDSPHCDHCDHNPLLLSSGLPSKLQTLASQLYQHPELLEMLTMKIETSVDVQGSGGTDDWHADGSIEVGDSDSAWSFTGSGNVDHSSGGETDVSVSVGVKRGF